MSSPVLLDAVVAVDVAVPAVLVRGVVSCSQLVAEFVRPAQRPVPLGQSRTDLTAERLQLTAAGRVRSVSTSALGTGRRKISLCALT